MAAGRIVVPNWMPAVNADGAPIPNAQMFFYLSMTTTLATIYADMALTTPLPNPIAANSSGQFPAIWADDTKLFSVTVDAPYGPPGVPFTFDDLGPSTATNVTVVNKADKDGGNVGPEFAENAPVLRAAASAVARPIAEKLEETLSVADFDDPVLGNKFSFAQAASDGRSIHVPPGLYGLAYSLGGESSWILDGPVILVGPGAETGLPGRVLQTAGVKNPDGTLAFANPVLAGPDQREGIQEFIDLTARVSPLNVSTLVGYSTFGHAGVLGFTDSGINPNPGYDEGGIGLFGVALNRKTGADKKGVYAMYLDAIRYAGAGITHGMELDSINLGDVVTITPNAPFVGDITTGAWIMAGGGAVGAQTSTVGAFIGANGARWDKGIVFHDVGLADRGDGTGEAIAFGYKHYMAGYAANGAVTSRVYFNGVTPAAGTNLTFDDSGMSVLDLLSGVPRFNVNKDGFSFGPGDAQWMSYIKAGNVFTLGHPTAPVIYATPAGVNIPKDTTIGGPGGGGFSLLATNIPGAVNYVEVQGATGGNGALIRAQGADATSWLRLEGKSTSGVQLLISQVGNYADDAAAAAASVPIGGLYRTASNIKVRTA